MTLELRKTNKENFDDLISKGYRLIQLTNDLTPKKKGWTKTGFVFEIHYQEDCNYGIVGGSIHTDVEGNKGKLIFLDFDITEKIKVDGVLTKRIIPEAQSKLSKVLSIVKDREYYFTKSKNDGEHVGVLSNEDIPQGVVLYKHQDCKDLRVDTRNEKGYVVCIAPGYEIEKIPEIFGRVIPSLQGLMDSMKFIKSNGIVNETVDSLSEDFKEKSRQAMSHLDIKYFPELGTDKVSTHDVITFWTFSQRGLGTSEENTISRIMYLLSTFETTKNNPKTIQEIRKMYRMEINEFEDKIPEPNGKYVNKEWPLVAEIIKNEQCIITLRDSKKMWIYDKSEGVYVPNADTYIDEICQELIKQCTIRSRNEVKATIKSNKTMILPKDLFDSTHINTQNGILDPKTFELLPHSPVYLTTTKLPFSVNFEANNPKLWDHILTIIDENDINLIMELIWICISGNNPFKKLFVFKGPPNTQKTTLSDIIVWIIGEDNVSREKPLQFLSKDSRFSTSKFIGKRMNTASEISNLTKSMIENQKSLVGAEKQNTERKNDNTERHFDPTKFVFLYTTNTLGSIYSSIDDNSIITRYQFIIFRNVIDESKANGSWYEDFFNDDEDRQTAIETVVRKVIEYKRGHSLGKIPKTRWSNTVDTKKILQEEMPKEDKYFDEKRIVRSDGDKVSIVDVKNDFESFVGYEVTEVQLGHILKRNGIRSSQSSSMTWYKGWKLSKGNNTTLD